MQVATGFEPEIDHTASLAVNLLAEYADFSATLNLGNIFLLHAFISENVDRATVLVSYRVDDHLSAKSFFELSILKSSRENHIYHKLSSRTDI